MLEISDEVLGDALGTLVVSACFIITSLFVLREAMKRNSISLLFFMLSWFTMGITFTLNGISFLISSPVLFKIEESIIFPVSLIFFISFVGYTYKEGIQWKQISIAFVMQGFFICFFWYPGINVYVNIMDGGLLISNESLYLWLSNFHFILMTGYLFMLSLVTYLKSSGNLKKPAFTFLFSEIMLVIATTSLCIVTATDTYDDWFFIPIGCLIASMIISTVVLIRNPPLIHLLPYKCYRLIITNKKGAIFYIKEFSKHDINDTLLAALFASINDATRHTLNEVEAGDIEEIKLQNAVFTMNTRYSPVNIGILSSNTSAALTNALNRFSKAFVETNYVILYNDDGSKKPIDKEDLNEEKIKELVDVYFSNIPVDE